MSKKIDLINVKKLLRFASYAKYKDVTPETVRQWKLRQTINVIIIDDVQFVYLTDDEYNEFYNFKK